MPSFVVVLWDSVLVHPLVLGLIYLSSLFGAGFAIILFTIVTKTILLPLTIKQLGSQRAMTRLQPELKALQARYAKDKEKLSVETMALYKEHGVNPAAGCLPLLLQMPILFALYAALRTLADPKATLDEPRAWLIALGMDDATLATAITSFKQGFWWLESLDKPDVIHVFGYALPFILPVLAGATQWVQQRMMTQPSSDPQQQMQNQMMQFMPLMMLWIGLSVNSGLALYWVAQNLYGIIQQYFIGGLGSLATVRLPGTSTSAATVIDDTPPASGKARRVNGANRSSGSNGGDGRRTGGK